eukprot:278099_1
MDSVLVFPSSYFYVSLAIGVGALFYTRRQIQGYYRDYNAVVSLNNLSGKTAIITGGNSGIGLGSAIHLARMNAKVIIACRSSERAASAVKSIQQRSGNDNIHSMRLNLSDLKSVDAFAAEINQNNDIDIDYLVLNAGIYSSSSLSNDGLCERFQVNYLGHWYLTNLLLDRIKTTADKRWVESANKYGAPVRIVSVSSGAHSGSDLPLDNDDEWDKLIKSECTYGQSKLLQIVHMKQLQTILHEYDQMIQCVSITPGMVRTNIFTVHWLWHVFYPLIWYLSRDIMCGSQVILHALTNDKITNGAYYSNCRLKPSKGVNGCSNDSSVWHKVWKRTQNLIELEQTFCRHD